MESRFSFKDFENVRLKATYKLEIGNRTMEPGETIAVFDKIQIARIVDEVERVSAHGGYGDRDHVFWTTTKDEVIDFTQGVFSATHFSLMCNARLMEYVDTHPLLITNEESLESDAEGFIELKEVPIANLWIYNKQTGEKILNYGINDNVVQIETPYLEVIVIYDYNYLGGVKEFQLGQELFKGFLSLEGRTRVKDDITGQVVTGILKIPKLRLMSNLSIRLGAQATPVVGNFSAIAVPFGPKECSYVSEFYLLEDDIDSDL